MNRWGHKIDENSSAETIKTVRKCSYTKASENTFFSMVPVTAANKIKRKKEVSENLSIGSRSYGIKCSPLFNKDLVM